MSLKSNLIAIRQSLNVRYLIVSWLFLGLSLLGWVVGNFIFSKIGESLYKLLLKTSNEKGALVITLSIGLFISSSLAYFFFASFFVKADNQFWTEKPEHVLMPLSKVFKTSVVMFILLSGIAFLSWVLYMIISPRLLELNYLTFLPMGVLIFLPFITRLIYYPAIIAISSFSTTGQLNNLFSATKRKTAQVLISFLLQMLILLIIVGLTYVLTGSFIYDLYVNSAFHSSSFPEFASNFTEVLKEIDYIKLAVVFIVSAPIFSIFANLQVSVIRNLIGAYNKGNYEKHYNAYSKEKESVKFDMVEDIEESAPNVSSNSNDNPEKAPGNVSVNLDPFQGVQIDEAAETVKEDAFSHFNLDNDLDKTEQSAALAQSDDTPSINEQDQEIIQNVHVPNSADTSIPDYPIEQNPQNSLNYNQKNEAAPPLPPPLTQAPSTVQSPPQAQAPPTAQSAPPPLPIGPPPEQASISSQEERSIVEDIPDMPLDFPGKSS